MRRQGRWRSWVVFGICCGISWIAPALWKQKIAGKLLTATSALTPERPLELPDPKALETWSLCQGLEKERAALWIEAAALSKQRVAEQLDQLNPLRVEAQLAEVIFDPPSHASRVIWIKTTTEVAKNSVVTFGDALVGYVDLAQAKMARVRLLSDPLCHVSARVLRPSHPLQSLQHELQQWVAYGKQLKLSTPQQQWIETLEQVSEEMVQEGTGWQPCAKGLIVGTGNRSGAARLKGIGFNYAWPDSYGSAQSRSALVAVGDELVCSGLDGRFPAGLRIGRVQQVDQKDPAATLYELEAVAAAPALEQLHWVWVLPPVLPSLPST